MSRLNVLLLAVLLASCLYLVRVAYESRRLFTEVDRAQGRQRQLETEFGRLQTERQAQATPSRVEATAREKLGMRTATPAITQYVGVMAAQPASAAAVPR
jgi:cell division protein FtsL